MSWYVLATLGYFLWISVVMPLTFEAEKWLQAIPESESMRAVGQWGPWLTLVLALIAAVVSRLAEHDPDRELPVHCCTTNTTGVSTGSLSRGSC